jgi:hypothetical protein
MAGENAPRIPRRELRDRIAERAISKSTHLEKHTFFLEGRVDTLEKQLRSEERWKFAPGIIDRLMVVECSCSEAVRDRGEDLERSIYLRGVNSTCNWHGAGSKSAMGVS